MLVDDIIEDNFDEDVNSEEEEAVIYHDVNDTKDYKFPNNLSNKRNADLSNYRPIFFKNYIPNDENFALEKLTYFNKIAEIEKAFEKKVKKSVKEFLNIEKNPMNVVPKKNNIDLKKNLAKKLERLNKKTELAILELIKEKIKTQDSNDLGNNLVMATNMQMNIQEEEEKNEFNDEDDGEISSDYEKGL